MGNAEGDDAKTAVKCTEEILQEKNEKYSFNGFIQSEL